MSPVLPLPGDTQVGELEVAVRDGRTPTTLSGVRTLAVPLVDSQLLAECEIL